MNRSSSPSLLSQKNPGDPLFFHPSAHPFRPRDVHRADEASSMMDYSVSAWGQDAAFQQIDKTTRRTSQLRRPSTTQRCSPLNYGSSGSSSCGMPFDITEIEVIDRDHAISGSTLIQRRYSINDIQLDGESSLSNSSSCDFMTCLLRIAHTVAKLGPMPDPWIDHHDDEDSTSRTSVETETFSTDSFSGSEDTPWIITESLQERIHTTIISDS